MITAEEIEGILKKNLQGAEIRVQDMTGTYDHYEVSVVWPGFEGKGLIQQHQVVNQLLAAQLDDGSIHALKIKTRAK